MDLERLWDPALDALLDEQRAWNSRLPQEDDPGVWTPERIARARDLERVMGGVFAGRGGEGFEERRIAGPAGSLVLRCFVPEEVRAVYLDVHGGGFFMGSAAMDDAGNVWLARRARVATVSVEYRLAPEHPWPAAPDDCEAAALWLLAHAQREFGSARLLIGGGSAGANLALLVLLRLRDRHGAAGGFAGADLRYGVYDLAGTPSQQHAGVPSYRDLYLPRASAGERRRAEVSPLYADLSGMPPALLTVGTADSLLDDSLLLALRWRMAGGRVELALYPEARHGFDLFPTAMARAARERIGAWLSARAAAPGAR
jgi:acetyl esterase/lipase